MCIEWPCKSKQQVIGFWCNNDVKTRDGHAMNFRKLPLKVNYLPKPCVQNNCIIRMLWINNDIREFQAKEFFPYISINGVFSLELMVYPMKPIQHRNWEIKEIISNKYKIGLSDLKEQSFSKGTNMMVTIDLKKRIWIKDIDSINKVLLFSKYKDKEDQWLVDRENSVLKIENRKASLNDLSEFCSFTILMDRAYNFSYKNWYLRTIKETATEIENKKEVVKTKYIGMLDLESKIP